MKIVGMIVAGRSPGLNVRAPFLGLARGSSIHPPYRLGLERLKRVPRDGQLRSLFYAGQVC